jgi:hypothetical protein
VKKIEKPRFKLLMISAFVFILGISVIPGHGAEGGIPKIGPVRMNPHPSTLEGKTVLLRWNGKYNGDKFLSRLGELLAQQVKNVRIIKMWETDKSTAVISKNPEVSEQVAAGIAKLKPDLVIAAQAD